MGKKREKRTKKKKKKKTSRVASHESYALLSRSEQERAKNNIDESRSEPGYTPSREASSGDDDDMSQPRPPLLRPTDGRSQQPLLQEENRRLSGSSAVEEGPMLAPSEERHPRTQSFARSRSPEYRAEHLTRRKYLIAGGFLLLSLASFVLQTETAAYIQHDLGWAKPYAML